jgi:hypothetical protein
VYAERRPRGQLLAQRRQYGVWVRQVAYQVGGEDAVEGSVDARGGEPFGLGVDERHPLRPVGLLGLGEHSG